MRKHEGFWKFTDTTVAIGCPIVTFLKEKYRKQLFTYDDFKKDHAVAYELYNAGTGRTPPNDAAKKIAGGCSWSVQLKEKVIVKVA